MRKEHFAQKVHSLIQKSLFNGKVTFGVKSLLFSPKRNFAENGPQKVSRSDSLHNEMSTGDARGALF